MLYQQHEIEPLSPEDSLRIMFFSGVVCIAQVVECLASMHEAPGSVPSTDIDRDIEREHVHCLGFVINYVLVSPPTPIFIC